MLILPISGLLAMPDVNFYFQKEYLEKLTKEKPEPGDEALFLILKQDKKPDCLTAEDFYPVGVLGNVTEIDEEGNVNIQTKARVEAEVLGIEGDDWNLTFSVREDIEDMNEQERAEAFKEVQTALLQYISGFQWGLLARNYVLRWKTLEEMAVGMSYHLSLSDEEKYQILEADRISERYQKIRQAVYEFIEVAKVSADAEKAQTESNEKLYREEAVTNQLAILQK